jgi:hypothetical protein
MNFRVTDPADPTLRLDFLSNERPIFASRVGTYAGRAMHSNHMATRVWDQYASREVQQRPADPAVMEVMKGGGRGYYRPPSLLSVWAYAPFMLNNAIGPEVCGKPTDPLELYRSPYVVRGTWMGMPNPPRCVTFDPSVEGRYRLFKASIEELLNPASRLPKITLVDEPIVIDGPIFPGRAEGFELQIPAGIPAAIPANLRHKELIGDLVLVKTNVQALRTKYAARGADDVNRIVTTLQDILKQLTVGIVASADSVVSAIGRDHLSFIQQMYSNSTVEIENDGHTFGSLLSAADKKALTAFLATL